MIGGLRLFARLASFVAAMWILAVVAWPLATGAKSESPPSIVIWMFIGGMLAQLVLWFLSRLTRPA